MDSDDKSALLVGMTSYITPSPLLLKLVVHPELAVDHRGAERDQTPNEHARRLGREHVSPCGPTDRPVSDHRPQGREAAGDRCVDEGELQHLVAPAADGDRRSAAPGAGVAGPGARAADGALDVRGLPGRHRDRGLRCRLGRLLQSHVLPEKLSRVYAYNWFGSLAFIPIGQAAAGPLASWVGMRATIAGAAVVVLLATLAALALRSVRDMRRVEVREDVPGLQDPVAQLDGAAVS